MPHIQLKQIVLLVCLLGMVPSKAEKTGRISVDLGLELKTGESFIPYFGIRQPHIVLALSGGGVRGLAQIGVLQVLERHGIPVEGIAGTSMGAIVGGLYAMGYSSSELTELIEMINWDEIIHDAPQRDQLFLGQKSERVQHLLQLRLKGFSLDIPSAYSAGQKLNFLLTDLVLNAPCHYENNFDQLPIPFRSVATDLLTGGKRVIRSGSIIDAMRASMGIPLLFTPLQMDGALLVDGGLVQNVPVDEARNLNADLVIAVDTSSKLRTQKQMKAPWEMADQVTTIMMQKQLNSQLSKADIVIRPDLSGISNMDTEDIQAIIQAGVDAAEEMISSIDSLLALKMTSEKPDYPCSQLIIEGTHSKTARQLLLPSGAPEDLDQVFWNGQSLLQTGYFQNLEMEIDTSTQTLYCYATETPLVQGIVFHGNSVPDTTLLAAMQTRPGQQLNIFTGSQDLRSLVNYYHNKGYFLAKIERTEFREGTIYIWINEGIVRKIKVEGNDKTRPLVIYRELGLKTGKPLHGPSLKQGLVNLYSTGFFESVRFEVQPSDGQYVLRILLEEQGNTLLRTGFRYDLERKSSGSFQFLEDNLFGFGGKGSIKGIWGPRDESLTAYMRTDRLLNSYLTYDLGASMERHQYTYYHQLADSGDFDHTRIFGYLSIGQQMKRLGTLSVIFQAERCFIHPTTTSMFESSDHSLRTLTLRSEVDSRNRYPFPQSGNYHILEYESGLTFLGSEIAYTCFSSRMEFYYPISRKWVMHPQISWGTADKTTPFVKQYRLGGLHSFIGLPENTFIGKRYMTINSELRYQLPGIGWMESYLSARFDFGGIWETYSEIEKEDFRQGFGFLLSFRTLFGPVTLGWGRYDQRKNTFYFSAGYEL